MAEKDMITMSRREAKRLHILHQALDNKMTQVAAADLLGLSERQIRRIIRRIREEGDEGICHRSRGKESNHRIARKVKQRALKLFQQEYADFNLAHTTEKLFEVHGILINDETLRLWLQEAEISYKKRRVKKHRQRRERKAYVGELVQIDGSRHDWFEGRGPICVFLGYIDDATGTVSGRFYDYEGTLPAMDSMKRYIQRYGIPKSVYVDKHTTYKSWAEPTLEEQLAGHKPRSHFEKSLCELEVEVIHANSPQAKGSVERLFKTLQDRLVREMRLLGIKSVEEANGFLQTYLPKHNRKFKKPAVSDVDLHRPAPHPGELDRILCIGVSLFSFCIPQWPDEFPQKAQRPAGKSDHARHKSVTGHGKRAGTKPRESVKTNSRKKKQHEKWACRPQRQQEQCSPRQGVPGVVERDVRQG